MTAQPLPALASGDPSAWDQALYAFLVEKGNRSGSRRTVESYSRMLWPFFADLGKTPDRVKPADVLAWVHGIGRSGRTPSATTVGARIACLSSYYRFLIRMGLVVSNPCDAIERPRATQSVARGYGADEVGDWTEDDDWELPRNGYGYRPGMTGAELRDSVRAWWTLSPVSASGYEYAIAVYRGVTLGIWQINQASWRMASEETCRRLGKSHRRWAFETQPAPADIALAFVGPNGRLVPARRPNGQHLFGSGAVFAYWPA